MKKQTLIMLGCLGALLPSFARADTSGHIIGCDGQPVSGVTIHVETPDGQVVPSYGYIESDSTGHFRIQQCSYPNVLVFVKMGTDIRVVYQCGEIMTIYFCCRDCDSSCNSDRDYSYAGTGSQKFTTRTCNCDGTCTESTSYRCTAGYYGNPNASAPHCTPCPAPGTSGTGAYSISHCYIPSGTTGSDASGTFTYTSNCYY